MWEDFTCWLDSVACILEYTVNDKSFRIIMILIRTSPHKSSVSFESVTNVVSMSRPVIRMYLVSAYLLSLCQITPLSYCLLTLPELALLSIHWAFPLVVKIIVNGRPNFISTNEKIHLALFLTAAYFDHSFRKVFHVQTRIKTMCPYLIKFHNSLQVLIFPTFSVEFHSSSMMAKSRETFFAQQPDIANGKR